MWWTSGWRWNRRWRWRTRRRAHGELEHPSQIAGGHALVRYFFNSSGKPTPIVFRKDGEQVAVEGKYVVAVNDSHALLAAGLAGLGLVHTLRFMAQPHIDDGTLVPVLQDWSVEANTISVVYMPNRHLSVRVRAFVDWLVELFKSHPHILP